MDNCHVIQLIMMMLDDSHDTMSLGLTCRAFYPIACEVLYLRLGHKTGVLRNFRIGVPCLISRALESAPPNVKSFPGMDILEACYGRKKERLWQLNTLLTRRCYAFAMGRICAHSPVSLLDDFLFRMVLTTNFYTTTQSCQN